MSQQQFRLRFNEGFEQGEKLCSRGERIALGSAGRFGLRVAVDPPVASNVYIDSGISFLILTAFFTDTNLFPVDEWPCHVRVWAPLVEHPESRDRLEISELYMIAFGELHPPDS